MANTKKKTQYKCGGCGTLGHNKRACPQKTAASDPAPAVLKGSDPADAPAAEPVVVGSPVEEPPPSPKIAIDGNSDLVDGHRTPNTRPVAPAAPYDCPTCSRVGILEVSRCDASTA